MIDSRATALDKMLSLHGELLTDVRHVEIFRAVTGTYLERLSGCDLWLYQTFKPDAEPLMQAGFRVNVEAETPTDLCIVFATKHREETLEHLARAVARLREGGLLIVTAANELGAPSLERRCAELLGSVSSYSKQKCRVFWKQKHEQDLNQAVLSEWLNYAHYKPVGQSGLIACPGMFSAKSLDPGSRLLAEHLPATLKGRGADFGAGYGYLSHTALTRCPGIREWHVYEAEDKALTAARRNLAGIGDTVDIHYHWCNLLGLSLSPHGSQETYDCIVMNPPFHTGRDSRPELGQGFIRAAVQNLAPGGMLYLVANRQLPYEQTLQSLGLKGECLATAQGYKVIAARR